MENIYLIQHTPQVECWCWCVENISFIQHTPQVECEEGDPDACVRCAGKVFEAERITAKAGPFHKYCMSCIKCNGALDASTFLNGPDGEIYCKHCYAEGFGHKAKSEYKGWMDSKTIMGEDGDSDACPRCGGKVFEAEKCPTKVGPFHSNCFSCIECTRKLDSVTCCEGPDGEIYCKACYAGEKPNGNKKYFEPLLIQDTLDRSPGQGTEGRPLGREQRT